VVGDWDGDGKTSIGVVDPAALWYLKNTVAPGAPNVAPFAYGAGSWVPVPAAWAPPPQALHAAGVGPRAAALTREQLDAAVAGSRWGGGWGGAGAGWGARGWRRCGSRCATWAGTPWGWPPQPTGRCGLTTTARGTAGSWTRRRCKTRSSGAGPGGR